jgi:hypothetical protein
MSPSKGVLRYKNFSRKTTVANLEAYDGALNVNEKN